MTFAVVLSLLASLSFAQKDYQACPQGWVRVPTRDPNEPFHCRREMDPSTPFIEMTPNRNVQHCPKGFVPKRTPGQVERYRCVKEEAKPSGEPDVSPVLTAPKQAPSQEKAKTAAKAQSMQFLQYTMSGVLQFEYPQDWHVTDAWNDSVPTIYIEYDTGRQGKQPTLVITKYSSDQEGWVDMDTAIAQEKEFQNSREMNPTRVSGLSARVTGVAKEARTVYVGAGKTQYFVLSYSAPEDLFDAYSGAFSRLVATFRLSRRALEVPR